MQLEATFPPGLTAPATNNTSTQPFPSLLHLFSLLRYRFSRHHQYTMASLNDFVDLSAPYLAGMSPPILAYLRICM